MIAGKVSILLEDVKKGFKSFIPIIILLIYTAIGAVIFMAIEGPNEKYEMEQLRQQREKLLEDTAFRLNTVKSMTPLQAYNHTIGTLVRYRDMLGITEASMNRTKWNIWGSIYYSMTIYTTIGYGNIVPATTTGRVLTIIYAFIGIPFAIITLIALGGLFARVCMYVWKLIARSLGCFSKNLERKMTRLGPDETVSNTESEDDSEELLNFPVGFLIGCTIIWILTCAYIFTLMEETWDYGLSLYFVLISFTTIGFGDVIVSKFNYILIVGLMLLIGLALVSTTLQIIQKQIHALADDMKGKIDKDYQTALEQMDDADTIRGASIEPIDGKVDYESGRERKDPRSLDAVISRMPWKSRLIYRVMPAGNKKQLAKHMKHRQNVGAKWVQTDPWLLDTICPGNDNPNY